MIPYFLYICSNTRGMERQFMRKGGPNGFFGGMYRLARNSDLSKWLSNEEVIISLLVQNFKYRKPSH